MSAAAGSKGRAARRTVVVLAAGMASAVASALGIATAVAAPATASLSTVVLPAIGPGYAITAQGPLDPSTFASNSPDPAGAGQALATLGRGVDTYERVWLDGSHTNAVEDLLVRFSSPAAAQIFLRSARHALDSGEIVRDVPVASVPGARRTTYFGSTNQPGVGEAITMRAGDYVALVSFFSAAAGNAAPISPDDAARVAKAQQSAMASAPGGTDPASRGVMLSSLGWAVLVVAVLALAVATPVAVQRRRASSQAAPAPQPHTQPHTH